MVDDVIFNTKSRPKCLVPYAATCPPVAIYKLLSPDEWRGDNTMVSYSLLSC